MDKVVPILLLLAVVGLVLWRLPKVEIQHAPAYRRRRFFNWFPLGLTYSLLYMGRYNLTVAKNAFADMGLMSNADFGDIFGVGAIVYGCAFVINGPLCDRFGGRRTILIGTVGALVINLLMGLVVVFGYTGNLKLIYTLLYAANMYFQSFGAVSIVKVNAAWFHVRERGVLGGIFGILISLGLWFAFDVNRWILKASSVEWVFLAPALLLAAFFIIDFFLVRDNPSDAGFDDFDVGDASSGDEGPRLPVAQVFKKMLTNPVILVIMGIEFCSGFLRNAIMHWGLIFSKQTGLSGTFVFANWGLVQTCAGILAGMFAGVISDYVFKSRRGPVAAILYGGMVGGTLVVFLTLESWTVGWAVTFMMLCVIGVHGMLSGTASADFGGKKNAGVAVGIIDAAVYLGTGAQALILGRLLPDGAEATNAANWIAWPAVMLPLAVLGLILSLKIWNAKPKAASAGH